MRSVLAWVGLVGVLPCLLGVNEQRYEPVWFPPLYPVSISYIDGVPRCVAFHAGQENTGPVTLEVPPFRHSGELVKPAPAGGWQSLDPGEIGAGELVLACRCGDVFVLTVAPPGTTIAAICQGAPS